MLITDLLALSNGLARWSGLGMNIIGKLVTRQYGKEVYISPFHDAEVQSNQPVTR